MEVALRALPVVMLGFVLVFVAVAVVEAEVVVAFLLVGDNKLGFAMMREDRLRARLSAAASDAVCVWLLLLVPLPLVPLPPPPTRGGGSLVPNLAM